MNATGPPVKRESRSGKAAVLGNLLADNRQDFCVAQPESVQAVPWNGFSNEILLRWFGEAERIARLYQRTGSVRHLKAFVRMIAGIMVAVERTLP